MKAIFKFNSGNGALLCSKCNIIIKIGWDFNEEEKQAMKGKIKLPAQYCEKCKSEDNEHRRNTKRTKN